MYVKRHTWPEHPHMPAEEAEADLTVVDDGCLCPRPLHEKEKVGDHCPDVKLGAHQLRGVRGHGLQGEEEGTHALKLEKEELCSLNIIASPFK